MKINNFCWYCKMNSHNTEVCLSLKNKNKIKQYQNHNKLPNQPQKSAMWFQGGAGRNSYKNKNFEKNLKI